MNDTAVFSELWIPPPAVARHMEKQPECRLLWAILVDGIETYMNHAFATRQRGRRLFREAEEWIMHDDPTWLCSFVNICHILGLNPDYLRQRLGRWCTEHSAPTLKRAA